MALPTNASPIYTLEIPSTKKQFKYRPFTVKDEKALLMAQQSNDIGVMLDTVKDVIRVCAKNEIDVDNLASFDIEYIFLQMRANSIGELVEMIFSCDVDHGEDNAKARVQKSINLFEAKVEQFGDHKNTIPLFNDVCVVMKYPTIDTLKKIEALTVENPEAVFDIVIDCIDSIYDGDEVYPAHEQKREDLEEFVNNLTPKQYDDIINFTRSTPKLRVYVDYTCPVCGREHNKYLEGLASFF